jgi:HlyD family secretion protein
MGHQSVLKSMVLLVILASLAIYFFEVYQEKKRAPLAASEASKDAQKPTAVSVEVMTPKEGGLERTTTQPGTVRAYEYEEIFSQVSGKLANQTVDIGSRVKKGQVLADIDAPELLKDEEYAHAVHKEALARVEQMKAHWEAAKQDWEAA